MRTDRSYCCGKPLLTKSGELLFWTLCKGVKSAAPKRHGLARSPVLVTAVGAAEDGHRVLVVGAANGQLAIFRKGVHQVSAPLLRSDGMVWTPVGTHSASWPPLLGLEQEMVRRTKTGKIMLPTMEKVQAKRWKHRRGIHRKTSPINSAFFVLVDRKNGTFVANNNRQSVLHISVVAYRIQHCSEALWTANKITA